MHLQTITFERVFSIRRFQQNGAWSTEFGFVADGKTHYTARVPGHPSFESGDTVTAVMGTPGRWTTMMGWLNHANGEIVYLDMSNTWVGRISILLFLSLFLTFSLDPNGALQSLGSRITMMCFAGLMLLILLNNLVLTRRARKAQRLVEELQRKHIAGANKGALPSLQSMFDK